VRARWITSLSIAFVCWVPVVAADSIEAAQAVGEVLDSLHRAASAAEGELYFSLFSEDAVFLGTDATERWTVDEFNAFARPYFDTGRGWTYEVKERHIGFAEGGATAWFDEMLWNEHYGTCRGSGVLVLANGGWRISQYNLTIPIPNVLARRVARQIRDYESSGNRGFARAELMVFLVRHAEKVDESRDPELSAIGMKRAQQLAEVLRDAGIDHIHSSDYIRNRDTAIPLAEILDLEVGLYDPDQQAAFTEQLRSMGGRHLVIGHSNTIPAAVELLGGDPGTPIDGHTEYDRLYVIAVSPDDTVSTTLLRFGAPYVPRTLTRSRAP